jgi:hypothetical protein
MNYSIINYFFILIFFINNVLANNCLPVPKYNVDSRYLYCTNCEYKTMEELYNEFTNWFLYNFY